MTTAAAPDGERAGFAGPVGTIATSVAPARQRRLVLAVALVVGCVSLALLPFVTQPLPEVPQVVPFYVAGVVITDLITAFLLFSQFRQDRSVALLVLACAYLFTGSIVVPHLLAFPDFTPGEGPLIGSLQSSAWLWHFWHIGFPAIALAHGLVSSAVPERRVPPGRTAAAIALALGAVAAAVLLLSLLATVWVDALPLLHDGRRWQEPTFTLGWTMAALTVAAIVSLWVPRQPRTFLHLWLTVALVAFFFDFTPNLLALQRYSIGWYLGRFNGLMASTVLLLMFLWETNRLYLRLGATSRALGRANATLEAQVRERTEHLERANEDAREALAARDVLLAEVYHRTKNNLQTLDALIAFEERQQGEDAKAAFRRARSRILAMSRVHQQLLESRDLTRVRLDRLVSALAADLALTHGAEERGVSLEVEAEPIGTDLETAAPLGLLINELVTNAFKHGLAGEAGGRLAIRVQRTGPARVVLEVADGGTGSGAPGASGPSAGSRIIEALCRQLRGEVETHSNGGTTVRVTMPLEEEDECPVPHVSSSSRTTS